MSPPSPLPHKLLTAAVALLIGLSLVELLLRLTGLDMALVAEVAPRMKHGHGVHRAVADPRLLIRLTPGASADYRLPGRAPFSVRVNALGFRGAERSPGKPPGVFRIVCVGASNTYGAELSDHQTWPHQLEARLNRGAAGRRFEVWNLGVSGYNSLQLVAVAEQALAAHSPDLIIFSMSNRGPRHFLHGAVSLETFRRDPTLWLETFPPALLRWPAWPALQTRLWLLGHAAVYRLALLGALGRSEQGQSGIPAAAEARYVEITRPFFERAMARTRLAIHICPAVQPRAAFEPHYAGLKVPLFLHEAEGKAPEFREIHPPAHVMVWYAEVMAAWLQAQGLLVPRRAGRGARRAQQQDGR